MADPDALGTAAAGLYSSTVYSRAAGTRDLTPEAAARRDRIEFRLLDCFQRYGFSRVDVPMLEYRDLYSPGRIGPDLFHHLVLARLPAAGTFPPDTHPNLGAASGGFTTHDAALRPDFTSPLARMLVTRMLAEDGVRQKLPVRWSYSGSVFRARTPRPLRLIEFRQTGVELMGASHAMADLEVLTMACHAARDLKIPDWQLHLGHAALFRSLVDLARPRSAEARNAMSHGLVLAARMRTRAGLGDAGFSRYLEGTRNTLRQRVRDWLTVPGEISESPRVHRRVATDWPELADPDSLDLGAWRERLPVLNERLLAETWSKTHGVSNKSIEALIRLAQSGGDPESFFSAVGRYVESLADGASPELLDRIDGQVGAFHDLTRDLRTALDSPLDLVVTAAASRGIAYYTGITFEIHTAATRTAYSNVCGGGRYSGLHRWLYERATHTAALRRGEPLPTAPLNRDVTESLTGVGFAFGIERLDAALQDQNAKRPRPDVYVVVEDAAFVRRAFHTAGRLRRAGLSVICELPTARYTVRGLKSQLASARSAGGRGAHHALIFGSANDRQGQVAVMTLDSGTQQTLHLAEAEAWLLAAASPGARP